MEIRRLHDGDAAAYWSLRLEALRAEPLAFGKSVEEHLLTTADEMAALMRGMPTQSFYMGAFEQDRLVAIALFIRETGIKEKHKGHVYGVYVSASERGNGLGRALLAAVLAKAKEDASLEQILLAAARGGDAGRLYLSLGFEIFGTEPRALKVGSEYVDEDQMILRIV